MSLIPFTEDRFVGDNIRFGTLMATGQEKSISGVLDVPLTRNCISVSNGISFHHVRDIFQTDR